MSSERMVIQSPTSFVGSTRRIWDMTRHGGPAVQWLVLAPLALIAIAGVWVLVVGWYLLFGLLVVPWRLLRRGQRKRKQEAMRHRELMGR